MVEESEMNDDVCVSTCKFRRSAALYKTIYGG
jgi:hypothetical protein